MTHHPDFGRLAELLKSFGLKGEQWEKVADALRSAIPEGDLDRYFGLESSFLLQGNGLRLKPFGLKEVFSPEYLQWMAEPEVLKTIGRLDYLLPVNREKLLDYFLSLDRSRTVFLAIYLDGPQTRLVGSLKIYNIDRSVGLASIGIMVGSREDWGKGIATRAIGLACDYLFGVLNLNKVTAAFYETNTGMAKAFRNCGFQNEAVLKKQILDEGRLIDHIHVCRFRQGIS